MKLVNIFLKKITTPYFIKWILLISSKPLQAIASHKCNLDLYKANYIFYNQDSFDLSYEISRPKKDYTIETSFNKIKG
ncbi:MAG: DUF6314 family protein [Candidatus Rickettsia vulgarisii]